MPSAASLDLAINLAGNAEKDIDGVANKLDKLDKSSNRLSKGMGLVGTAVATAFGGVLTNAVMGATSVVSDFFVGGFEDARGAQQLMAQTATTIKSMGNVAGFSADQIADMASSLSDAAGASLFGDDQIQAAQNFLLTFGNIRGQIFEDASAIAVDMATALGTEPQAQAMALGKALNDPVKGITALTRVGVSFTAQQIEQVKAMTAAGDVAGAQGLILEELGKQFGGSAQAAATAAGPWRQFQGILGETAETVSAKFVPLMDTLAQALVKPETQAAIATFADSIANGLGTAIGWFTDTAIPNIQTALTTVSALWSEAGEYTSSFGERVGAVVDSLFGFTDGIGPFQSFGIWLVDAFLPNAQTAFVAVRDAVLTFAQALSGSWTDSTQITEFHSVVGNLGIVVRDVFGWITDTAMPALSAAFTVAWPVIQSAVATFYDWFSTTAYPALSVAFGWLVDTGLPAVQSAFQTVWPVVQAATAAYFDWWMSNVYPVLQSTFNWISNTGLPALQAAWEVVWPAIKVSTAATWDFLSGTVWPGIQTAFDTIKTTVVTVQETWGTAWDTISSTTSTVVDAVSGYFDDLKSSAETAVTDTIGFFEGIGDSISSAVGDLSGILTAAGEDVINGLFGGISSAWEGGKKLLGAITKAIPELKGPASVDAKLLDPSGRLIIDGLFNAMNSQWNIRKGMLTTMTEALEWSLREGIQEAMNGIVAASQEGWSLFAQSMMVGIRATTALARDWMPDQGTADDITYANERYVVEPILQTGRSIEEAFEQVRQQLQGENPMQRLLDGVTNGFIRSPIQDGMGSLTGGLSGGLSGGGRSMPSQVAESILPRDVVDRVRGDAQAIRGEFEAPAWTPVIEGFNVTFGTVQTVVHDHMAIVGRHGYEVVDLLMRALKDLQNMIDSTNNKFSSMKGPPAATGGDPFGPLIPRAMGGPVVAGRGYLVGERGPEYFSPRTSGTITPNSQLSTGGDSYYITINAPNADAREVVRLVDERLSMKMNKRNTNARGR